MAKKSKGNGQMKRANGKNGNYVAKKKKAPRKKPPIKFGGTTRVA